MIDIITTRFREAYTWVVPPDDRLQSRNFKKTTNSSIKRFSDELHKKETHVIIFRKSFSLFNFLFYGSMSLISFLLIIDVR